MNDCINREAFIGEIEKHYCAPCKGQGGDLGGDWCRSCVINSVLEKLREFPAADAVQVVHGRWIASYDEFCACSICKYPVYVGWNQTNYCPNCGAKMDKEGSMRIIKQGRPKATKNILRFRCCRCGCEFEADDTEYEQASQIAYVHDGIIATCICPCCGATVYIP